MPHTCCWKIWFWSCWSCCNWVNLICCSKSWESKDVVFEFEDELAESDCVSRPCICIRLFNRPMVSWALLGLWGIAPALVGKGGNMFGFCCWSCPGDSTEDMKSFCWWWSMTGLARWLRKKWEVLRWKRSRIAWKSSRAFRFRSASPTSPSIYIPKYILSGNWISRGLTIRRTWLLLGNELERSAFPGEERLSFDKNRGPASDAFRAIRKMKVQTVAAMSLKMYVGFN